ncbi:hypothetical protein N9F18_00795 [bacterium]|jgi:hypothetical protein|nr:hypothetical protein [bacterium]
MTTGKHFKKKELEQIIEEFMKVQNMSLPPLELKDILTELYNKAQKTTKK